MPSVLPESQIERYQAEGVLFPIAVLTEAEVMGARTGFEELCAALGGRPRPEQLRHPHLHFRWAYDLALSPRVLDAVQDLIGPDILVHSCTIFCKSPGDGSYVSWHQDGHYWGLSAPHLTSAWIALCDSNVDNGCMRVVPGSHRGGNLPHAETSVSERNLLTSGLELAVAVDESDARDVVLRAGEMSLHHVDIVHGSNANHSAALRLGYAVRYLAPHVKQKIGHHPVVLARGRDDYGHYEILAAPPGENIEHGIASQVESTRRMRLLRELRDRAS